MPVNNRMPVLINNRTEVLVEPRLISTTATTIISLLSSSLLLLPLPDVGAHQQREKKLSSTQTEENKNKKN